MTATFDLALPTAKDRLRRALGDADTTAALRQDEEYAAVLTQFAGNETAALVEMASGLATEYAQKPDSVSDEDGAITWKDRVPTWLKIAATGRADLLKAAEVVTGKAVSVAVMRDHDEAHSEYRRDDRRRWEGHHGN
jgi:hypothetical protein